MSRYIDVDKAIDAISTCKGQRCYEDRDIYIKRILNELPSADVEPVRHGYWKVVNDGYGDKAYICECSECKDTVWVYTNADRKWNYCPNCGARMDGKEQEKNDV